jgi:peptidoglycan/LPS O-acetylase OafA/YrhL
VTTTTPATHATPTTHRYHPGHLTYPGLDGLRALAVLAVVVTHCAFWTGRYERGWGMTALARLDSGVAVFFVLSGFLLVRPWLTAARTRGPRPSTRVYALRRVARIMPAYLAAVTLALLTLPQNDDATPADWLRHLFLVQIYQYGWMREGLTQTWSLATEVAFYVILPFVGAAIVWSMRRRWRPGALVAGLALVALLPLPWYAFLERASGSIWVSAGYWLPGFAGWFAGGMALAVIRSHLDSGAAPPRSRWWLAEELGRHPLTCWALAAVTFFIASTPVAGPRSLVASTVAEAVTKQTLYLVMALALVWPAVFGDARLTRAVLGNRVMRFSGDISYGVFLYHLVVLDAVMVLLDNQVFTGRVIHVLPLTLAGSVAIATVSFRFLERPIIRWAHRRPLGVAAPSAGTERTPSASRG